MILSIRDIKGIGPKTESLMNRLGLNTAEDLLRYYPVGYDLYPAPARISDLRVGEKSAVRARIAKDAVLRRFSKLTVVTLDVSDGGGVLRLTWYNAPYIAKALLRGREYVFRGMVREKKGTLLMEQPEFFPLEKYRDLEGRLVPVYGLTKGLSGKTIAKAVRQVLDDCAGTPIGESRGGNIGEFDCKSGKEATGKSCGENIGETVCKPGRETTGKSGGILSEYLPADLRRSLALCGEAEALAGIHFPKNAQALEAARSRLVFDEFFLFILGIRLLKSREEKRESPYPMTPVWETEEIMERLPYRLTGAQLRAWREIEGQLAGHALMSRLLQGDVGSGKTVIAFLAMAMTARNGYQSALMAPTEVLAGQHYEKLMKLKEAQGLDYLRPALITGSTRAGERREILRGIAAGEINAVIGTHAVFQEKVEYDALALVITDEQHRFGVRQRESLSKKGGSPHALVMSATPIPRTLGVIYYGDLDISVIDERPKERRSIKSAVVDSSYMEKAERFLMKEMTAGHQAYVICPMIEPSEELELANVREETARLKKAFPGKQVAMLHGAMTGEEKNRVMEGFAGGDIDLIVSTTVVEVGVDVPNATVMLIENAERFGLAQLHQLRGRVGRGDAQSYCIFMAGASRESTLERLNILKESDDGFVIAEKDFALRGPGDLLGIRQSGDARFRLADVTRDAPLLSLAGRAAASLLEADPLLSLPGHAGIAGRLARSLNEAESGLAL